MNWPDILAVSIPSLLTGAVGYGSATLAYRQKERRTQRLDAAGAVIPRLEAMRRLVRYADVHADGAEWHTAAANALDALEAELHRLPRGWRHLLQSVRIAIGEASGAVAFADRTPEGTEVHLAPYCPTWAGYAEDYFSYVIRNLRVWRDDLRSRQRRVPKLLAFDPWLQQRGLGEPCACGGPRQHLELNGVQE